MLPEIVVTVPMTEIPVMVKVVEAAKAETQRPIDRIVRVSLVSAVDPGVSSRAVIRLCRTGGKDKPDTQQQLYCLGDCFFGSSLQPPLSCGGSTFAGIEMGASD